MFGLTDKLGEVEEDTKIYFATRWDRRFTQLESPDSTQKQPGAIAIVIQQAAAMASSSR